MSNAAHATDPNRASQPQPSRLSRIAQRAHEIYDARGGQDGKDLDDWLQAEREIDAEMEAETETPRAARLSARPSERTQ